MIVLLILGFGLISGKIQPCLNNYLRDAKDYDMIPIIVHMKNQADLSQLPILSKNGKIDFLKKFAKAKQERLLKFLTDFPDQVKDIKTFWIFNGVALKSTKDLILSLAKREDIAYISYDSKIMLDEDLGIKGEREFRTPTWNIEKVKADSCWSEGYNGSGVIVGNIDTGVDTTHPALRGKWYPGGWFDAVNNLPGPYDDHGHGTFTMGIICGGDGNGPFVDDIGVSPGAKFIVAKAFNNQGAATISDIHESYQWFATQNAKIINNPWSQRESDSLSLEFWNDLLNLLNLGIISVFKVGTTTAPAPQGSAKVPGSYPVVIAAGATDSLDNVMGWSCRGPAPNHPPWNNSSYWFRQDWNLIKPDLAAPGFHIISSWPGGGYELSNGTSWAATHLAGACAILLQRDSTLTPAEMYNILLEHADRPSQGGPYPNMNYGWGRLNIYAALHSLNVEDKTAQKILESVIIYPNPFKNHLNIKFAIRNLQSEIFLRIYDATGRMVRDFSRLTVNCTRPTILWDGTDNHGIIVSPGVYLIEISLQNKKMMEKVVFTR
ncbi:MAG: S8 family serine peptidase [bacterium]